MPVQMVAEIGLYSAAAAVEQLPHAVPRHAAEQRDAEQQEDGMLDGRKAGGGAQGVDALLDELGSEGGEDVGDHHQQHAQRVVAPVWPEEGQQRPKLVHDRWNVTASSEPGKSHQRGGETMTRTMLAALTLLAAAACGRGDKRDVASADSLNRDLQLAPVDTNATLND